MELKDIVEPWAGDIGPGPCNVRHSCRRSSHHLFAKIPCGGVMLIYPETCHMCKHSCIITEGTKRTWIREVLWCKLEGKETTASSKCPCFETKTSGGKIITRPFKLLIQDEIDRSPEEQ